MNDRGQSRLSLRTLLSVLSCKFHSCNIFLGLPSTSILITTCGSTRTARRPRRMINNVAIDSGERTLMFGRSWMDSDHSNPRLSSDYRVFNKVAEPSSRRLYGCQSPFKHCSISLIILTPECQELGIAAAQYALPASLLSIQPPTQARCCPPEPLLSIQPDSTCPKHETSTVYSPKLLRGMITECKQLLNYSANTESRLPPVTAFSHLNGSLLRRKQHIARQSAKRSFRLEPLPIHLFSLWGLSSFLGHGM